VAEYVELAPVRRGRTVDETLANVQEAAALHLQGGGPGRTGARCQSHHHGHHRAGTCLRVRPSTGAKCICWPSPWLRARAIR